MQFLLLILRRIICFVIVNGRRHCQWYFGVILNLVASTSYPWVTALQVVRFQMLFVPFSALGVGIINKESVQTLFLLTPNIIQTQVVQIKKAVILNGLVTEAVSLVLIEERGCFPGLIYTWSLPICSFESARWWKTLSLSVWRFRNHVKDVYLGCFFLEHL